MESLGYRAEYWDRYREFGQGHNILELFPQLKTFHLVYLIFKILKILLHWTYECCVFVILFLLYALKYIILRHYYVLSIDITKMGKEFLLKCIIQLTSFTVYMKNEKITLNNFCFKDEYLV